ncbi:MAG: efflux RND transporter periplasmic adaptor subunit, partial [Gammaproteobacteria bacterium]|nr:efflux RND transporter periplasmic adaptor subunit [Gammaproteobacteria bacterium]
MNILRLVLITLCLYGCTERTSQEPRTQNIRPAKIMTVTSQSDEVVHEFSARIEALQSVDLSFQVGGPLAEQPIREGETLSTGSLIASLDPTDFKLAVREAEVQLRLAAQDLNRKRKVLAENGIAKSHVEDARSHYELQKVRLSRAKEQLEDSQIHAPFKAYVSRRYFDRHVNVRPGEPIVRLHDLTSLQVVINIPEYLLATV